MGILLGLSFGAQAQGFSRGDHFFATPVTGQVLAHCLDAGPGLPGAPGSPGTPGSGGPSMVRYNCRDMILEPSQEDYFIGPQGIVADSVDLQVTQANGSTRMKSFAYDSRKFRTKKAVNLGLASLFQRPFLNEGLNHFSFTMKQADQVVAGGQFEVQVDRGAPRTCPNSTMTFWGPNECSNQVSVCGNYFSYHQTLTWPRAPGAPA